MLNNTNLCEHVHAGRLCVCRRARARAHLCEAFLKEYGKFELRTRITLKSTEDCTAGKG